APRRRNGHRRGQLIHARRPQKDMTMRPDPDTADTNAEGIPPASPREAEDARAATSHAVGERYFRAVAARDVEAAVACWRPGEREVVHGILDEPAPEGVRTFLGGVFAALPDAQTAVLSITAATA